MITINLPTTAGEVKAVMRPRLSRAHSWMRRALNLRASEATRAAVHLQLVYLGQDGLVIPCPDKAIANLSEREACALIRDARKAREEHIAAMFRVPPHLVGRCAQ